MITRREKRFPVIFVAMTLLAAVQALAADVFPLRLQDQMNRTVVVPAKPQRIVSCSPGSTEILFALGLGDAVAGVTNWCNYPPEAKKVEKIGDLFPLNVEKIVSLRPDLVIAHQMNDQASVETLAGMKLPVLVLKPDSFADILASIALIGKATGSTAKAGPLTARLKNTLDEVGVKGKAISTRGLKVFIMLGWDPFWTAGPGSFIDEAVTLCGGVNIAGDLNAAWAEMSLESILKRNPDVIITDTDPGKVYADSAWRGVSAVAKQQVYKMIGDEFYRPGPRLVEALDDLVLLLGKSR